MIECQADGAALQRKRLRRQKRWLKRLAISSVLLGLGMGGWAFGDANAPQGLKGILPAEVPATLTASAFEPLGETWKEWNATAAEAIAAFYKADGDVAAQKAALDKVKIKLGVLNTAISDSQYSMILEELLAIRGPLARRVAVADAAFTTLETDSAAARAAAVKASGDGVSAAFGALKNDLEGVPAGTAWLPYIYADELATAWSASWDNDAAIAALKATHTRLMTRDTLTDSEQKSFLSRPAFVGLSSAIETHLATVEMAKKPVDIAQTRAALTELVEALEAYETYSSSLDSGKVRAAVHKLSEVAPDGGAAITRALDEHYFNLNLRLVASESFLNRLLGDCRVEQGQVCDFILGAQVGGWQTTSTSVSVDVKPADSVAKFDVVLSGVVQSTTAGRTSQATIYTSGYHTFHSSKEVTYNGMHFATGPATTGVRANNTTTGARTKLSGFPLLGRMTEKIALRAAADRRPEAEAIAAGRVWSRVNPRFDEEVDKAFNDASAELDSKLVAGLKETGLYPDEQALASTETQLSLASRLMGEGRLGGDSAEPTLLNVSSGAAMLMHESLVNNTIDQVGFSKKKLTEEGLRKHLEDFLSKALAREFKFRSPEATATETAPKPNDGTDVPVPSPAEEKTEDGATDNSEAAMLAFTEFDPVRIRFRDGKIILEIRAGLEFTDRDPIPPCEIRAVLDASVELDVIWLRLNELSVLGIEGEKQPTGGQLRIMYDRIKKQLPDRPVDANFTLKSTNREVPAKVVGMQIVDGWIVVRVE